MVRVFFVVGKERDCLPSPSVDFAEKCFFDLVRSPGRKAEHVEVVFVRTAGGTPVKNVASCVFYVVTDDRFRVEIEIEILGLAGQKKMLLIPLRDIVMDVSLFSHGKTRALKRYMNEEI